MPLNAFSVETVTDSVLVWALVQIGQPAVSAALATIRINDKTDYFLITVNKFVPNFSRFFKSAFKF
uniref:Secreted protein n=1 Tax=Syphacia muris TaxID=451379 RepID=A0A0N5AKM8_9BILA